MEQNGPDGAERTAADELPSQAEEGRVHDVKAPEVQIPNEEAAAAPCADAKESGEKPSESGQKPIRTAEIGRSLFDASHELATVVIELLKLYSHSVLFSMGVYSGSAFKVRRYGNVLLHRCVLSEIRRYVNSCLRSVHRWVKHARVKRFAASILHESGRCLVTYSLRLRFAKCSNIAEAERFVRYVRVLKRRFTKLLLAVEANAYEHHHEWLTQRVRFAVSAQLRRRCGYRKRRPMEIAWKEKNRNKTREALSISAERIRISSKLLKANFSIVDYPNEEGVIEL